MMSEKELHKELADLEFMTPGRLREKHRELFGDESRSKNRQWLYRRCAWWLQELARGGLSERAPYLQSWPPMRLWLVEIADAPPEGVEALAIDTIDWMVQRIVEHVVLDLDGKAEYLVQSQSVSGSLAEAIRSGRFRRTSGGAGGSVEQVNIGPAGTQRRNLE